MNTQSKKQVPDYPALYHAADRASVVSQRRYLFAIKVYVLFTVIGALFSNYLASSTESGIIAALIFFALLALSIFQANKRFDKIWYNGRAVAESVKTRTWRFITRAEPYIDNEKVDNVKMEFCNDLKEILDQNEELAEYFLHESILGETITEEMLKIRSWDFKERLEYYISNRINEQRNWYYTKSKMNNKYARNWFISLVIVHLLIISFLLIEIGYGAYWLPTNSLIVVSSSILMWMQIKKYQDLATSYSLTAHEIGILKSQVFNVIDEKSLSDFVKDSENAFSREHTQWVARKDN